MHLSIQRKEKKSTVRFMIKFQPPKAFVFITALSAWKNFGEV